jgi:ribosomal protein L11 methyltransferase
MQAIDFKGKAVLDFGTGTGVLAILAARLGAASILAIDNDDWCIENAGENIEKNNCMTVRVEKIDKIPPNDTFNVILANINKHVLLREMPVMEQQLKEGGVILMSGLLEEDFDDIEKEAIIDNLTVFGRMTRGSWICLKMGKKTK